MSRTARVRLLTIVVILLAWEGLSRSGLVYVGVFPGLGAIFSSVVDRLASAEFYYHFAVTFYQVIVGAAIGGLIGLAVGVLFRIAPFVGGMLEPFVNYFAPMPKVILLPILLILFGVGSGSKIAMAGLSCFFPVAVATFAGMQQVNPVHLRVARSFNAGHWQTIRKVYLPSITLPVITGFRLGIAVAIIGTLLAQIKLSNAGLGYLIIQYYNHFKIADMYAVLLLTFAVAVVVNVGMDRLERARLRRGAA